MDARPFVAVQYHQSAEGSIMGEREEYKYLKPKPGSNYQQLFVNGRIRAEILYRETVGPEPLSPEEVAGVEWRPPGRRLEAGWHLLGYPPEWEGARHSEGGANQSSVRVRRWLRPALFKTQL